MTPEQRILRADILGSALGVVETLPEGLRIAIELLERGRSADSAQILDSWIMGASAALESVRMVREGRQTGEGEE